jgi:hypothetical protein
MVGLSHVLSLFLLVVVLIAAGCHLIDPHAWWQELVCSYTLAWLPLIVVGCVVALVRLVRARRYPIWDWTTLTLGVVLLGVLLGLVWPYWRYTHGTKLSQDEAIAVGVFYAHVGARQSDVAHFEERMRALVPELLVLRGESDALALQPQLSARFPYTVRTAPAGDSTLQIFSKFPLGVGTRADLGIATLPALYAKVELDQEVAFEFGVVSLRESRSADAFHLSRITSRRMASAMRNSITPRMVIGDFSASPFSQIVAMYNRQARLRSVFSGQGLRAWWDMQGIVHQDNNVNAFVSAGVHVSGAVVVSDLHPDTRSLFTVVYVPRTTIVPIERSMGSF